ncbi:MAG: hypothetical protein WCI72_04740 [archaeon]
MHDLVELIERDTRFFIRSSKVLVEIAKSDGAVRIHTPNYGVIMPNSVGGFYLDSDALKMRIHSNTSGAFGEIYFGTVFDSIKNHGWVDKVNACYPVLVSTYEGAGNILDLTK